MLELNIDDCLVIFASLICLKFEQGSRVLFRLLIMHRWLLGVGLSSPFGTLACDVVWWSVWKLTFYAAYIVSPTGKHWSALVGISRLVCSLQSIFEVFETLVNWQDGTVTCFDWCRNNYSVSLFAD